MKESYECEVATHIGPESCGAAREGGVEALTRERAGRVFSRGRQLLRDADAVKRCGRLHRVHRYREVCQSPARSQTPCTYGSTSNGNREIPASPRVAVDLGRIVCGASSLAGCLCLLSVIPILCGAWASLPKARAGCGKAARPDPWRGSGAIVIPTPTVTFAVWAASSSPCLAFRW